LGCQQKKINQAFGGQQASSLSKAAKGMRCGIGIQTYLP
jgi:hypothetical protein